MSKLVLTRTNSLSRIALRVGAFITVMGMAACGGGGGGGGGSTAPTGPTLSLAANSLNFSATSPSASVPASQFVTAVISGTVSGTLFVRIVVTGDAVTNVTGITVNPTNQTGQASVIPASPGNLGTGTHTSVITVSACTTNINCSGPQLAGSPQTLNVTYTVGSSVQADAVAPYIGTTGKTGDVIIRGQGFAPATTVSFNGTPATTSSFLSDTEIHASYPATLIAGNNAVQLNNGAIPFTESLKIVDAPAYASTTLNYPSPPQQVRGLVYDAERKALLVGVSFADASTNQILRYAFASGAWPSTPTSATLANLRDLALSLNGSKLLAISDAAMAEADPVTLGVSASRAKPTATVEPEYLKSVVVANDGNAVITTGFGGGSGSTRLYLYSASQSAFSTPTQAGLNATKFFFYAVAGASADGAIVTIMESGLSSPQPVYRYTASTGILAATSFSIQHNNPDLNQNINAPAFDRAGSRMAVAQVVGIGSPFGIYDASFALLGLLPSTTAAYAVSPDGTRAYTVEIASPCQVRAFDLLSTPGGFNALTEIVTGFPITPVACPDNAAPHNIKMLVNPAGDTLFIAGNLLIAVVPLP